MFRPDQRRQIDAVIDYFGGAGDTRTACSREWRTGSGQEMLARNALVAGPRNRKLFTIDGPFAETKEHVGGV
jgi:hypothetical protein